MTRFVCLILCLMLLIAGCFRQHASKAATNRDLVFYLVRHAEKADDGSKDPPLSTAGISRAQSLARLLSQHGLDVVYSTDYRRTRMTAEPTATAQALKVAIYDAKMPVDEFASALRTAHISGNILIVGHSNTTAEIAATLCMCHIEAWRDDEYDRLIEVRINGARRMRMIEKHY